MAHPTLSHSLIRHVLRALAVPAAALAALGSQAQEEPPLLNAVLDVDSLYRQLEPLPVHGETASELLWELQAKHYASVDIDDRFSSTVFDRYLDTLDGSHLYFLANDVDALSSYRYTLDDSLQQGSVEPGFAIYNLYHRRMLERLVYAIRRVENHLAEMDFSMEEYIDIDREDDPYAASVAELDEIWRKRIKQSVLSLRLTGRSTDEIRDRLSKRYRNQLRQVLKTNERDVFQTYLSTVARTADPHTDYYSPRDSENFNMQLSLSLQGIGAQLSSDQEYTKVVELIKGGPAERGGELRKGDRIIGIGQGNDGEIQDVVGMRLDDVVSQIRGEKGTVVRLSVIPANAISESSATVVSITRDTVKLEDQSAKGEVLELDFRDQVYRIGVVTLPTFYFDFEAAAQGEANYKSSTRDVRAILQDLQRENVDAVVMDLRNNGGGSLSEANQLVGLFIETGVTVQIRYSGIRNGYTRSFGDNDPEVVYDGPLAVLVNRTSASASEIFAGAIQDYQRGIVLGGQTFGKGTVQEIIPMDFGQIKITRSKFYRISGASTQHRGVIPDIAFPDFYDAYEDVGESSLDGALPWDTVRAVEYRPYHPIQTILPRLKERHEDRASASPDFNYLLDQIERTRRYREKDLLPLKESLVRQERERNRREEFEAENMRRFLKGLPLKEWIEEEQLHGQEGDDAGDDAATLASSNNDSTTDPEPAEPEDVDQLQEEDPLLLESGRILADLIALTSRRISVVDQQPTMR